NKYRGVSRGLLVSELATDSSQKSFKELLKLYLDYITIVNEEMSIIDFKKVIEIYTEFKNRKVNCECILFDNKPIKEFMQYKLEFLGVDIINDYSESLLSDVPDKFRCRFLNHNGLCNNASIIETIIPMLNPGNEEWSAGYVFKVIV
ncbi:MAG: hypothetical protein IJS45_08725, partial [Clostridia bacterium]|nr:hypothetical protein [Clostridia bacterium]